jgi:hypothetical protein
MSKKCETIPLNIIQIMGRYGCNKILFYAEKSIPSSVDQMPRKNYCQYITKLKGIVSPDWKGLQMVSLDRFEV